MFTVLAFAMGLAIAVYVGRSNNKERESVGAFNDDLVRQSVVFAREDLRLIAFALGAILIMLGIIADKLP